MLAHADETDDSHARPDAPRVRRRSSRVGCGRERASTGEQLLRAWFSVRRRRRLNYALGPKSLRALPQHAQLRGDIRGRGRGGSLLGLNEHADAISTLVLRTAGIGCGLKRARFRACREAFDFGEAGT